METDDQRREREMSCMLVHTLAAQAKAKDKAKAKAGLGLRN